MPNLLTPVGIDSFFIHKFSAVTASTSGDSNTLVTAVTGKQIRVVALALSAAGAVNAKFSSSPTSSPSYITGLFYFSAAGSQLVLPFHPFGWFETESGKALGVNLSAGTAIAGCLVYIEA